MEDSYSEVSTESWFSRISNSIKGILFGAGLFAIAFPVLFWNEGRAVDRYKTLQEGRGQVVSISSTDVDSVNNETLVHVQGRAETDEILEDPVFGISQKALKLRRIVEMYQWHESVQRRSKRKIGGKKVTTKTYYYSKRWSKMLIPSANFKKPEMHQNPKRIPYQSITYTAKVIRLGNFVLSSSLAGKISSFCQLPVVDKHHLPQEIQRKTCIRQGKIYSCENPLNPQVGDVRISFKVVRPLDISLVAEQVGNSFKTYRTSNGGAIELLQPGLYSAEEMFKQARRSNAIMTWVLRLVGFLSMLVGLVLIFRPLTILSDVLPILGSIVGVGTGLVALLLATALSLSVISIAWLFYRPLLAIFLIAAVAGIAIFTKKKLSAEQGSKKKNLSSSPE